MSKLFPRILISEHFSPSSAWLNNHPIKSVLDSLSSSVCIEYDDDSTTKHPNPLLYCNYLAIGSEFTEKYKSKPLSVNQLVMYGKSVFPVRCETYVPTHDLKWMPWGENELIRAISTFGINLLICNYVANTLFDFNIIITNQETISKDIVVLRQEENKLYLMVPDGFVPSNRKNTKFIALRKENELSPLGATRFVPEDVMFRFMNFKWFVISNKVYNIPMSLIETAFIASDKQPLLGTVLPESVDEFSNAFSINVHIIVTDRVSDTTLYYAFEHDSPTARIFLVRDVVDNTTYICSKTVPRLAQMHTVKEITRPREYITKISTPVFAEAKNLMDPSEETLFIERLSLPDENSTQLDDIPLIENTNGNLYFIKQLLKRNRSTLIDLPKFEVRVVVKAKDNEQTKNKTQIFFSPKKKTMFKDLMGSICQGIGLLNASVYFVNSDGSYPEQNDITGFLLFFQHVGTFLELELDNAPNDGYSLMLKLHLYNLLRLFYTMLKDITSDKFSQARTTEHILWFLYTFLLRRSAHLNTYYPKFEKVARACDVVSFTNDLFMFLDFGSFKWQIKSVHKWLFAYVTYFHAECTLATDMILNHVSKFMTKFGVLDTSSTWAESVSSSSSGKRKKRPIEFVHDLLQFHSNKLDERHIPLDLTNVFALTPQPGMPSLSAFDIYCHSQMHAIMMEHLYNSKHLVNIGDMCSELSFSVQTIDDIPLLQYNWCPKFAHAIDPKDIYRFSNDDKPVERFTQNQFVPIDVEPNLKIAEIELEIMDSIAEQDRAQAIQYIKEYFEARKKWIQEKIANAISERLKVAKNTEFLKESKVFNYTYSKISNGIDNLFSLNIIHNSDLPVWFEYVEAKLNGQTPPVADKYPLYKKNMIRVDRKTRNDEFKKWFYAAKAWKFLKTKMMSYKTMQIKESEMKKLYKSISAFEIDKSANLVLLYNSSNESILKESPEHSFKLFSDGFIAQISAMRNSETKATRKYANLFMSKFDGLQSRVLDFPTLSIVHRIYKVLVPVRKIQPIYAQLCYETAQISNFALEIIRRSGNVQFEELFNHVSNIEKVTAHMLHASSLNPNNLFWPMACNVKSRVEQNNREENIDKTEAEIIENYDYKIIPIIDGACLPMAFSTQTTVSIKKVQSIIASLPGIQDQRWSRLRKLNSHARFGMPLVYQAARLMTDDITQLNKHRFSKTDARVYFDHCKYLVAPKMSVYYNKSNVPALLKTLFSLVSAKQISPLVLKSEISVDFEPSIISSVPSSLSNIWFGVTQKEKKDTTRSIKKTGRVIEDDEETALSPASSSSSSSAAKTQVIIELVLSGVIVASKETRHFILPEYKCAFKGMRSLRSQLTLLTFEITPQPSLPARFSRFYTFGGFVHRIDSNGFADNTKAPRISYKANDDTTSTSIEKVSVAVSIAKTINVATRIPCGSFSLTHLRPIYKTGQVLKGKLFVPGIVTSLSSDNYSTLWHGKSKMADHKLVILKWSPMERRVDFDLLVNLRTSIQSNIDAPFASHVRDVLDQAKDSNKYDNMETSNYTTAFMIVEHMLGWPSAADTTRTKILNPGTESERRVPVSINFVNEAIPLNYVSVPLFNPSIPEVFISKPVVADKVLNPTKTPQYRQRDRGEEQEGELAITKRQRTGAFIGANTSKKLTSPYFLIQAAKSKTLPGDRSSAESEKVRKELLLEALEDQEFWRRLYLWIYNKTDDSVPYNEDRYEEYEKTLSRLKACYAYFPELMTVLDLLIERTRLHEDEETKKINTNFTFTSLFREKFAQSKRDIIYDILEAQIPSARLSKQVKGETILDPDGEPWAQDYKTDVMWVLNNKNETNNRLYFNRLLISLISKELNDHALYYDKIKTLCIIISENLYCLLTRVVCASHKSFEDSITESVFSPLLAQWLAIGVRIVFIPQFQVLETLSTTPSSTGSKKTVFTLNLKKKWMKRFEASFSEKQAPVGAKSESDTPTSPADEESNELGVLTDDDAESEQEVESEAESDIEDEKLFEDEDEEEDEEDEATDVSDDEEEDEEEGEEEDYSSTVFLETKFLVSEISKAQLENTIGTILQNVVKHHLITQSEGAIFWPGDLLFHKNSSPEVVNYFNTRLNTIFNAIEKPTTPQDHKVSLQDLKDYFGEVARLRVDNLESPLNTSKVYVITEPSGERSAKIAAITAKTATAISFINELNNLPAEESGTVKEVNKNVIQELIRTGFVDESILYVRKHIVKHLAIEHTKQVPSSRSRFIDALNTGNIDYIEIAVPAIVYAYQRMETPSYAVVANKILEEIDTLSANASGNVDTSVVFELFDQIGLPSNLFVNELLDLSDFLRENAFKEIEEFAITDSTTTKMIRTSPTTAKLDAVMRRVIGIEQDSLLKTKMKDYTVEFTSFSRVEAIYANFLDYLRTEKNSSVKEAVLKTIYIISYLLVRTNIVPNDSSIKTKVEALSKLCAKLFNPNIGDYSKEKEILGISGLTITSIPELVKQIKEISPKDALGYKLAPSDTLNENILSVVPRNNVFAIAEIDDAVVTHFFFSYATVFHLQLAEILKTESRTLRQRYRKRCEIMSNAISVGGISKDETLVSVANSHNPILFQKRLVDRIKLL